MCRWPMLMVVGVVGVGVACSPAPDEGGCSPGESRACACADSSAGEQLCGPSGAFGDCSCQAAGPDAGVNPGPVDGGAPGPADGGTESPWPARSQDYVGERVSYLSQLTVPERDGSGAYSCCRDFDARSRDTGIDNGWAKLWHQFGPMVGMSLEEELQTALEDGRLVLLLDHRELVGASAPFLLASFTAEFSGTTGYAEAAAGAGEFLLRPSSFLAGSGEPRDQFPNASLSGARLQTEGLTLHMPLPMLGAAVEVPVREARLGAREQAAGTYLDGELSGYLTLDDLFGAYNAFLASEVCECLQLQGPVYEKVGGQWSGNCHSEAAQLCPEQSQLDCVRLAGEGGGEGCSIIPMLLQNAADLDADADGSWDSFSVGLRWAGVPGQARGCYPGPTDSCAACAADADCAGFDDADLCNGRFRCLAGSCRVDPASVTDCSGAASGSCEVGWCEPATGACQVDPVADGSSCDPDACTLGGSCVGGQCVGGAPLLCDDGNECTEEICDPFAGCIVQALDGMACTSPDLCVAQAVCDGGSCEPRALVECDDGNPCTQEWCEGGTGLCQTDRFGLDGMSCGEDPCSPGFCAGGLCETEPVVCHNYDCTLVACGTSGGCDPVGLLPDFVGCGNGIVECSEECDDGNSISGDGCTASCRLEWCGDGIVQHARGEVCDDGDAWGGGGCRFDCRGFEECGDGLLDRGEDCDDGNQVAGDGCAPDCAGP